LDERGITLTIGQRVRLVSDRFFPDDGYRDSRITRISRNVERPNEADIEISDVISRTSQSSMQESITAVRHEFKTSTNTFPGIIRSWDNTLPTDNNIFSARRVLRESLSKKHNDSAAGLIRFLAGAEFGEYKKEEIGAAIDRLGNAEFLTAVVRSMLRSTKFVDGFTGEGFALGIDAETGLAGLTLDKLTVRQTMSIMELLINKIRSVGGQIIVSAANGKIKTVQRSGNNYVITFETENTFAANDLVRCSTFTGNALKAYWVKVTSSNTNGITVPVSEFLGQVPAEGDECVLMGNTTDTSRQNLILISATGDGQPRIDVLNGVKQKNFNGCLRARLGSLDGIEDSWFPADKQPQGYGLYADNVFLRGMFMLEAGKDVKTVIEMVEGHVRYQVGSVLGMLDEKKDFLSNAYFEHGMESWDTAGTEASLFIADNKWIWLNGSTYGIKGRHAAVREDGGRKVMYIQNNSIRQTNENLQDKPDISKNMDGQYRPRTVYLSFFYHVLTAGRLTVEFENVDKTGFENFNSLKIERDIEATDGYVRFMGDGLWNGTGDFVLTFTGGIYIYDLQVSTDRVSALTRQTQTLYEQTDKLIRIAATNFDGDGKPLQSSQIVTKADMNLIASGLFDEQSGQLIEGAGLITRSDMVGMFVIGKDGKLVSLVEASTEGVKIKASNIEFEGLVTANENFKIDETGSIEARNAKIFGEITAINGRIGEYLINEKGFYSGEPSEWRNAAHKQNLALVTTGFIGLQKQVGYFKPGDVANIKVGIGDGADPTITDPEKYCYSAGYFYRQLNAASSLDNYYHAVKIISDNPIYDVALYTEGAIVCRGGMITSGYIMDVAANNVTVINLSYGNTILVLTVGTNISLTIWLPKKADVQALLGITDQITKFAVPITITAAYNNPHHIKIQFQNW
jgi:hypothetical protein